MRKPEDRTWVQVDLPRDVMKTVETLAEEETISRLAWIRRALIKAAREPATV